LGLHGLNGRLVQVLHDVGDRRLGRGRARGGLFKQRALVVVALARFAEPRAIGQHAARDDAAAILVAGLPAAPKVAYGDLGAHALKNIVDRADGDADRVLDDLFVGRAAARTLEEVGPGTFHADRRAAPVVGQLVARGVAVLPAESRL